jgi:hypothetical protein
MNICVSSFQSPVVGRAAGSRAAGDGIGSFELNSSDDDSNSSNGGQVRLISLCSLAYFVANVSEEGIDFFPSTLLVRLCVYRLKMKSVYYLLNLCHFSKAAFRYNA